PTVGAGGGLVRDHACDVVLCEGDLVRPGDMAGGHEADVDAREPDVVLGADVLGHVGADGRDPAVVLNGCLQLDDVLAGVDGGHHVLRPVLDPPNGPPQLHGQPADQDVFAVHVAFATEGTPHVGGHHPDVAFGQRQDVGEHGPGDVWALGPGP